MKSFADMNDNDLETIYLLAKNIVPLYRQLADGLSDMVEEGRLTEADIPDDYRWLVEHLTKIAGVDPE